MGENTEEISTPNPLTFLLGTGQLICLWLKPVHEELKTAGAKASEDGNVIILFFPFYFLVSRRVNLSRCPKLSRTEWRRTFEGPSLIGITQVKETGGRIYFITPSLFKIMCVKCMKNTKSKKRSWPVDIEWKVQREDECRKEKKDSEFQEKREKNGISFWKCMKGEATFKRKWYG